MLDNLRPISAHLGLPCGTCSRARDRPLPKELRSKFQAPSSNLRILYKSHVSDSCLSIHVSASLYLRNLCKIHVSGSVCISGSSARSMSPIHVSASLYLRVICKIHVFRFMPQHLRISGSFARSMCPIHVLASIYISGSSARSISPKSQFLRTSGISTRSMSSDSSFSIH